jgi:hypothetical protein
MGDDAALPTTWTRRDLAGFVDQVSDDRFLALWLMAATSGMRVGTLVELRCEDIDLVSERVHPRSVPGAHAELDPHEVHGTAMAVPTVNQLSVGWPVAHHSEPDHREHGRQSCVSGERRRVLHRSPGPPVLPPSSSPAPTW